MKNRRRYKADRSVRLLKGAACVIFFMVMAITILDLATSKYFLSELAKKSIHEQGINTDCYVEYKNYGFTEEMCEALLEGDDLLGLACNVLGERFGGVFHNISTYTYTMDFCTLRIEEELREVAETGGLALSDSDINDLVLFTMDVTGLTSLTAYNNPEEYKKDIFSAGSDSIIADLSAVAILTSVKTFFVLIVMYLILILVMCLVVNAEAADEELHFYVADTVIYPSVLISGLGIGEVFGFNAGLLTRYIFQIGICVAMGGMVLGVVVYFTAKAIMNRKKDRFVRKVVDNQW